MKIAFKTSPLDTLPVCVAGIIPARPREDISLLLSCADMRTYYLRADDWGLRKDGYFLSVLGEVIESEKQSTYSTIDLSLVGVSLIGLSSSADLSSVDLWALSSLDWGGLHCRKRGNDGEDFEEVGLHVGQYDIATYLWQDKVEKCEQ